MKIIKMHCLNDCFIQLCTYSLFAGNKILMMSLSIRKSLIGVISLVWQANARRSRRSSSDARPGSEAAWQPTGAVAASHNFVQRCLGRPHARAPPSKAAPRRALPPPTSSAHN